MSDIPAKLVEADPQDMMNLAVKRRPTVPGPVLKRLAHLAGINSGEIIDLWAHRVARTMKGQGEDLQAIRRQIGLDNAKSREWGTEDLHEE